MTDNPLHSRAASPVSEQEVGVSNIPEEVMVGMLANIDSSKALSEVKVVDKRMRRLAQEQLEQKQFQQAWAHYLHPLERTAFLASLLGNDAALQKSACAELKTIISNHQFSPVSSRQHWMWWQQQVLSNLLSKVAVDDAHESRLALAEIKEWFALLQNNAPLHRARLRAWLRRNPPNLQIISTEAIVLFVRGNFVFAEPKDKILYLMSITQILAFDQALEVVSGVFLDDASMYEKLIAIDSQAKLIQFLRKENLKRVFPEHIALINEAPLLADVDTATELLISLCDTDEPTISTETVILLLLGGAETSVLGDLLDTDRLGYTALMAAADFGHKNVVDALLAVEPNLEVKSELGRTALSFVAETGGECLRALLDAGAVGYTCDTVGNTPLMWAAASSRWGEISQSAVAIPSLLAAGTTEVNAQNNQGNTALMLAALHGTDKQLRAVLQANPDTEVLNALGQSAINVRTQHHCTLIEVGALVPATSEYWWSELVNTLDRSTNLVQALLVLQQFQFPNTIYYLDQYLWTRSLMMRTIARLNLDKNLITGLNRCLSVPALFSYLDANRLHVGNMGQDGAKELRVLKKLITLIPFDQAKALAVDFARQYNWAESELIAQASNERNLLTACTKARICAAVQSDMVPTFRQISSTRRTDQVSQQFIQLLFDAKTLDINQVLGLLAEGADVNTLMSNTNRDSALILAVAKGFTKFAGILLMLGADVEIKNKDGMNALMFAATRGDLRQVYILLSYDADVHAVNQAGHSAEQLSKSPQVKALLGKIYQVDDMSHLQDAIAALPDLLATLNFDNKEELNLAIFLTCRILSRFNVSYQKNRLMQMQTCGEVIQFLQSHGHEQTTMLDMMNSGAVIRYSSQNPPNIDVNDPRGDMLLSLKFIRR